MNFIHERPFESLNITTTTIHSNGWGGVRIELAEETFIDEYGGRKLDKFMSTVLSREDALRLRDLMNKQFPIK